MSKTSKRPLVKDPLCKRCGVGEDLGPWGTCINTKACEALVLARVKGQAK